MHKEPQLSIIYWPQMEDVSKMEFEKAKYQKYFTDTGGIVQSIKEPIQIPQVIKSRFAKDAWRGYHKYMTFTKRPDIFIALLANSSIMAFKIFPVSRTEVKLDSIYILNNSESSNTNNIEDFSIQGSHLYTLDNHGTICMISIDTIFQPEFKKVKQFECIRRTKDKSANSRLKPLEEINYFTCIGSSKRYLLSSFGLKEPKDAVGYYLYSTATLSLLDSFESLPLEQNSIIKIEPAKMFNNDSFWCMSVLKYISYFAVRSNRLHCLIEGYQFKNCPLEACLPLDNGRAIVRSAFDLTDKYASVVELKWLQY